MNPGDDQLKAGSDAAWNGVDASGEQQSAASGGPGHIDTRRALMEDRLGGAGELFDRRDLFGLPGHGE